MPYGILGHIGLGKETTWGSFTAATDYVEAMSETLQLTKNRFDVVNIQGGMYEPDDMVGLDIVGGDIAFSGHPEALGFFFNSMFGVQSATEILSGFLFANEFTMSQDDAANANANPAYTFEVSRNISSASQYVGCIVSAMELNIVPDAPLAVTATIIGKEENIIEKTTPSFTTSPVDVFAFDTASISVAGAGFALIESFTISLDTQLEGVATVNATTKVSKIKRTGPPLVRLSGTMCFEDHAEYDKFKAQTEQAISVNMTRADSFSLLMEFPRVIYNTYDMNMGGRERIVANFEGMARYHVGSASAAKFTLTNTKSWY